MRADFPYADQGFRAAIVAAAAGLGGQRPLSRSGSTDSVVNKRGGSRAATGGSHQRDKSCPQAD
jgi:hypothetical protein